MAEGLKRVIGFWGGAALVVGITIGSGIFAKPHTLSNAVQHPGFILGLWVAFGIISLCGALALAELSSMMPSTGGVYVYLRAAYGDAAAFVFGWLYLLVSTPATVGALATFFAQLLLGVLGVDPAKAPAFTLPAIAAGTVALLTAANLLGARLGTAIGSLFTAIKVGALAAIILGAFCSGGGSFANLGGGTMQGAAFGAAVASVIWAYDGWVAVSMVAGEIKDPDKRMTRIIVAGMAAIVALYVLANVAYFYRMPLEEMRRTKAVPQAIMAGILGDWAAGALGACIMASVFGALNGNVLTKPRVAYALAQDGLTFAALGRVHPKWGTPVVALVVQGAASVLLIFLLADRENPGGLFDALTTYFVVVEWFALLFAVGAVIVLRKRQPDTPRPFRTPLYPWVPLVFLVGTAYGLWEIVRGEIAREKPNWAPVWGLLVAMAGFPIYWAWRRSADRRPGGTAG